MAQKIIIKGVEYNYRLDLGAMLHYEYLLDKVPEDMRSPRRTAMVMHYACLVYDENFNMQFDEFLQAIDSQQVFEALSEAGEAEGKRWNIRNSLDVEKGADGEKKK